MSITGLLRLRYMLKAFWACKPILTTTEIVLPNLKAQSSYCYDILGSHNKLQTCTYLLEKRNCGNYYHSTFLPRQQVCLKSQAATAAAKSLQSCPTLCNPVDGSPPGSPIPGILQARTLEWVAISFSNAWKWKVKVQSLSYVTNLVLI